MATILYFIVSTIETASSVTVSCGTGFCLVTVITKYKLFFSNFVTIAFELINNKGPLLLYIFYVLKA